MWQTEGMLIFYHSERLKLHKEIDKGIDPAFTSIHLLMGIGKKKRKNNYNDKKKQD